MTSSELRNPETKTADAPRIDSHQHFWQYSAAQYPWMNEQMGILRRDHAPEQLDPLLKAAGFAGSVAVQARQTIEETEWLLQLAEAHDFVLGVVGWVDLRSPTLGKDLERFRANPKFVGVRHVLQDESDDEFMLRPEFLAGIAQLNDYGLAYDLLVYPRHLPIAARFVARFPDQRFVLDHLGKPPIRDKQISPWREDLRRLAEYPHVVCKLSGMVTEADWVQWEKPDFRPYLDAALKCFGTDRVMIGSDWPVCTLAGDYDSVMRIVLEYVQQFPAADRAAILGGNCARFYRLTLRNRQDRHHVCER